MTLRTIAIGLILSIAPALVAGQTPAPPQNPLHRQYREGETLVYNMTGLNESWKYTAQAANLMRSPRIRTRFVSAFRSIPTSRSFRPI
jgi:hypothetical protein